MLDINKTYSQMVVLPENDPRFKRLIEHLPKELISAIFNYKIDEGILDEKLKDIYNFKFYQEKGLYEVSEMAIQAYRISKMTFEELTTVFIHIGAMEEFYLHQKSVFTTLNHKAESTNFVIDLSYLASSFSPYIPEQTMRAQYMVTPRQMIKDAGAPDDYIDRLEKKHKLDVPYIKKFFHFNDSEWEKFCEEFEGSEKETWFTFLNYPICGSWSSLYERIVSLMHCFHVTKYVQPTASLDNPPNKIKYLLLPSFTMMQTALKVKALVHQRKWMELSPHFGVLSYDNLFTLKNVDKTPLGLYCPTPNWRDHEETIKHMRVVDGFGGSGPYGFILHDLVHALRWQEMNENCAKAVLYIVKMVDEHIKFLDKSSEMYKTSRKTRNSFIDGELIFSYPAENTLFKNRPFSPQSFGKIFELLQMPMALKNLILGDMVVNETFWKENFNINLSNLSDQDRRKALPGHRKLEQIF